MIGETIGNFRVTGKLGAGGMGEVFLAEQTSIETKVAIKVLRAEISVDRAHVDRFFNEARAVSRIKHAGTVKIFDVGFHTGHAYLVMEFLDGETLSARIRRGAMPLAQLCDIGKQTCGVLEATHTAGITHRDLKPDNIFLVTDSELASGERVKILDFGIAKLTGGTAAGKPQTVGTMGTPAYMAPEQWGDAGKVDARADVYSLGCVLFEMATGRTPFVTDSFAQACGAHLSQQPPKLRTITPAFPAQLEALIDSMLSKSPAGRPTLRDVVRVLGELATLPHVASPEQPTPAQVAATVAPNAPTYGVDLHHPTPVGQQTPQQHAPVPVAPVAPTLPVANQLTPPTHNPPNLVVGPDGQQRPHTTLSSATGSTQQPVTKSRAPLYAIGGLVVVGGIILFAVTRPGDPKKVATPTDAASKLEPDAAVASSPDAATVTPPDAGPTWEKPQFAELAGGKVMIKQATRGDYKSYLGALSEAARTTATPLKDWFADDRPNEPVGWVTYEQAQAFCAAVDGKLPSKDEWLTLAGGRWRIGSPVAGEVVFRDWTATVSEGLAVVLGGTTKMANDAARLAAVKNPLSKPTVASAGASPSPDTVAAATIGIRCIRGELALKGDARPPTASDLAGYVAALPGRGSKLRAALETSLGTLSCDLLPAKAPLTVANFVGLATGQKWFTDSQTGVAVKRRYYDGLTFHRVISGFMIQFGSPLGTGLGGPGYRFDNEIHDANQVDAGSLVMANAGPNTNGSQFFIAIKRSAYLDASNTVFGHCEPVDVLNKIANVPRGPDDKPATPVVIRKVDVTRLP